MKYHHSFCGYEIAGPDLVVVNAPGELFPVSEVYAVAAGSFIFINYSSNFLPADIIERHCHMGIIV